MKRTAILMATICFCLFTKAQDTVYLKKEAKKKIFTDRPPQAFFVEAGGAGVVLSANYDRRFKKQTDGLGYRAGIGYSFNNSFKFVTLPLGINYLAGNIRKGRFFEAGLNGTLIIVNNSTGYDDIFDTRTQEGNQTLFFTTLNLGYRSQPTTGGLNFRAGLMPYLLDGSTGVGAYISLGLNF